MRNASPGTADRWRLFVISFLILFLELACIRWFPAHVLFLTFFTNIVLLACFLGMSLGCLAARRLGSLLRHTPMWLAVALGLGHGAEMLRHWLEANIDVGHQAAPQLVYFGAEYKVSDVAQFAIPMEVFAAVFFLLLTTVMLGLGQELGRSLERVPNRLVAYTVNILGSLAGIVAFAVAAYLHLSPGWWFAIVVAGLWSLLYTPPLRKDLLERGAWWVLIILAGGLRAGTHGGGADEVQYHWSPYYRIDYQPQGQTIHVNQIGHQFMVARSAPYPAYGLPHVINRDAGRPAYKQVLIIGAGSGNDVSQALQWGAEAIDAVEIDPVIYRLGKAHHPDKPYDDPRVTIHLDDGRNFLQTTQKKYDLVIYALVDSLVLHSSYSNIRLESYLFTSQAFQDIRSVLKPDGQFIMYNFFRQGWIVSRLSATLEKVFGQVPLCLSLPYMPQIAEDTPYLSGFAVFVSGDTAAWRAAFAKQPVYRLPGTQPVNPQTPNGFTSALPEGQAQRYGLSEVVLANNLRLATDDWPFLYLRQPLLPDISLRGMAIMGGLTTLLLGLFLWRNRGQRTLPPMQTATMFFLGAGFMLVETRAVVHLALLFGSTWVVNTIVFFAILVMILLANLFVLRVQPRTLLPYFIGLGATLLLNVLIPLEAFLGLARPMQVLCSCLLVFAPIIFASVLFAVSFARTTAPDTAFGANIAGAMLGGLAENLSMAIGFQALVWVALAFYSGAALAALLPRRTSQQNH